MISYYCPPVNFIPFLFVSCFLSKKGNIFILKIILRFGQAVHELGVWHVASFTWILPHTTLKINQPAKDTFETVSGP